MVYIIIGLIILGLIVSFFSWLSDLIGGAGRLLIIIAVLVLAYLAFSWQGVFAVVAIALLGMVLGKAGRFIGIQVNQHDKRAKETAQIKQQTQKEQLIHHNDAALIEELNKNCYWLGCMDPEKWKKKLPNYANKQYTTSFETITMNFAKQIEQQHIIQNGDWFEPYKQYVVQHPGGSTVTKMLNEVNCPQLKMTHVTPDGDLINTWLVRGTKRVGKDVPELFRMTFIKELNESVFTPTEYLKKLYGSGDCADQGCAHTQELNFEDL